MSHKRLNHDWFILSYVIQVFYGIWNRPIIVFEIIYEFRGTKC